MKKVIYLVIPLLMTNVLSKDLDHTKYGAKAKCGALLKKKGYVNCYNNKQKGPSFVMYNAKDVYMPKNVLDTKAPLKEDLKVKKEYRVKISDYKQIKGYLPTKLKTTYLSSSKLSEKKESSLLSNTVPMKDIAYESWKEIEKYELSLIKKYNDLHIITGVIYLKRDPRKPDIIGIPEYFYKIIFSPDTNKMISFVVPQENHRKEKSFYNYAAPVKDIESKTGIKFFSKLEEEASVNLKKKISFF